MDFTNLITEKLDELIKIQKENNEILKNFIKIFQQYDEGYSSIIEKDGMKMPK